MSITKIALFHILIPVFDVITDLRLILILFVGGWTCINWYRNQSVSIGARIVCNADPNAYCNNNTITISHYHSVCKDDKVWSCKMENTLSQFGLVEFEHKLCELNPEFYCTNVVSHYQDHDFSECKYVAFPGFAIMLLVFFTLNYIVSFLHWSQIEKSKRSSIIFPLLNLFSPSGKSKSIFLSLQSFFF